MEQDYPGFSHFLFVEYIYNNTFKVSSLLEDPSSFLVSDGCTHRWQAWRDSARVLLHHGLELGQLAFSSNHKRPSGRLRHTFVCSLHRCKCKLFYSSPTIFLIWRVIAASSITIENLENRETVSRRPWLPRTARDVHAKSFELSRRLLLCLAGERRHWRSSFWGRQQPTQPNFQEHRRLCYSWRVETYNFKEWQHWRQFILVIRQLLRRTKQSQFYYILLV